VLLLVWRALRAAAVRARRAHARRPRRHRAGHGRWV